MPSGSRTGCRGSRSTQRRGAGRHRERHRCRRRMGDSAPTTPIGINLPNDRRFANARQQVGVAVERQRGLRQVHLAGVPPGVCVVAEEAARAEKWSAFAGELTTDLHEVIGHGSGKVAERLNGNPQNFLKEQYSALEEARADLVALYFVADPGWSSSGSSKPRIRTRLSAPNTRLRAQRAGAVATDPPGHADRGRSHAQPADDRPLVMANSQAIEVRKREGKTYYVMVDPGRSARASAGCSPRCSASSRKATTKRPRRCSNHGVHFDAKLRDEVVARVDRLQMPSYTGFVQPRLEPVTAPAARSRTCISAIRWI